MPLATGLISRPSPPLPDGGNANQKRVRRVLFPHLLDASSTRPPLPPGAEAALTGEGAAPNAAKKKPLLLSAATCARPTLLGKQTTVGLSERGATALPVSTQPLVPAGKAGVSKVAKAAVPAAPKLVAVTTSDVKGTPVVSPVVAQTTVATAPVTTTNEEIGNVSAVAESAASCIGKSGATPAGCAVAGPTCGVTETALPNSGSALPPVTSSDTLQWDGLSLAPRDLQCLEDGCMLNDSVVDFFLRLVHRFLAPRDDVYVFSCHFFTRLTAAGAADGEVGWENVRSWTKRVALFTHSYAVVPINSELHWWLAVIEFRSLHNGNALAAGSGSHPGKKEARIAWVDSLPGDAARYEHALQYLRGYLSREWRERGSLSATVARNSGCGVGNADKASICPLEVCACDDVDPAPEQENGVDCGVFMLENVVRLFSRKMVPDYDGDQVLPSSSTWCDQAQATQRRPGMRRTLHRLEAELRAAEKKIAGGCNTRVAASTHRNVPELLERSPEVVARLRSLWGLTSTTSVDGGAVSASASVAEIV